MNIEIIRIDYNDAQQAADLVGLLDAYARDAMGGGTPLPAHVRDNVCAALASLPHAFSLMCTVDAVPAGLINCFEGFSTFKCQPLVNVHDVVVLAAFRGLGISQRLLAATEVIAREKGCCKITLEVLEGNLVAQSAYRKFGFDGYQLDPATGRALFWQKLLENN